jgi:hypothetical protein
MVLGESMQIILTKEASTRVFVQWCLSTCHRDDGRGMERDTDVDRREWSDQAVMGVGESKTLSS